MSKKVKGYKPCLGKALKGLAALFAGIIMFAGCSCGQSQTQEPLPEPPSITIPEPVDPEPPVIEPVYTLPTLDEAKERLFEIYEKRENMYLLRNGVYRHAYVEDGAIGVNVCFEPSFVQKFLMAEVIEEYNNVFEVINPRYRFALNFSPSQEEINDQNNVNVYLTQLNENVGGNTRLFFKDVNKNIEGKELVACDIYLNESFSYDGRCFSNIFRHEFMHTLGCGDAYLLKDPPNNTIMQTVSYDMFGLYKIDVAFLDAFYRDVESEKTDEEIKQYIEHYDDYEHYSNNNTLLRLFQAHIIENEIPLLKENIENSAYSMADINTVLANLGEDIVLKPISDVEAFVNLKSDTRVDYYSYYDTPFGNKKKLETCNAYNTGNIKYSSHDIHYTFNDNLLYLSTRGANTAFIKVDDYVFGFKLTYKLSDITDDIESQFYGIYYPTESVSVDDFYNQTLEWDEDEKA